MNKKRLTGALKEKFRAILGDGVHFNVHLAGCTTIGVGGPADVLAEIENEEQLRRLLLLCRENGLPPLVIGRGSNIVVRDGGWRGVAFRLAGRAFRVVSVEGCRLAAGGAAPLAELIREAARHSLSGPEYLAGIPGTVGGAVRMNAGARGRCMGDWVESARLINRDGGVVETSGGRMGFSYRGCEALKEQVLLSVVLRLSEGDGGEIARRMRDCAADHASRLPAGASAGCVFKNPEGGPSAGKLIEEAGLKGVRAGGAVVAEEHGNVILNRGGAGAEDVLCLIRLARRRVWERTGIELETEVIIAGEDG